MQQDKSRRISAKVISHSGDKTVKVRIDYKVKHPKYGKYVRKSTSLAVHDELNQANVGDVIEIAESRPYSKTKSWRLVDIREKAAEK
jgi:small subunit ribosomal protein S17